jgi:hypothetical protein
MRKIVTFLVQMHLRTNLELYRQHKQRGNVCKSQKDRHEVAWALHDSEEVRLGYCVCVVAYVCSYGR